MGDRTERQERSSLRSIARLAGAFGWGGAIVAALDRAAGWRARFGRSDRRFA
jgi:hypothetical protein